MDALKSTAASQFGNAPVTLTDRTLEIMSEQAGVEAFALDTPSDANKLCGKLGL